MRWFGVDGARDYLAERGKNPSRKVLYGMVADGLRVARIGETGRRFVFSAEWIDEFLEQRAQSRVGRNAASRMGGEASK